MKKIIFVGLFLMVLYGAYGQTRTENRWLLGRWVGTFDGQSIEFVFNDNGTGRTNIFEEMTDINFSIYENTLTIHIFEGNDVGSIPFIIHRINDQRIVLSLFDNSILLNKRN